LQKTFVFLLTFGAFYGLLFTRHLVFRLPDLEYFSIFGLLFGLPQTILMFDGRFPNSRPV